VDPQPADLVVILEADVVAVSAETEPTSLELPPVPPPRVPDVIKEEEPYADTDLAEEAAAVEDLKYSMAGLEWYILDQADYEEHCPDTPWEQPAIEAYRHAPGSYLPEGCVPIQGEEGAVELQDVGEAPVTRPPRF
jgi:hypothetical protein